MKIQTLISEFDFPEHSLALSRLRSVHINQNGLRCSPYKTFEIRRGQYFLAQLDSLAKTVKNVHPNTSFKIQTKITGWWTTCDIRENAISNEYKQYLKNAPGWSWNTTIVISLLEADIEWTTSGPATSIPLLLALYPGNLQMKPWNQHELLFWRQHLQVVRFNQRMVGPMYTFSPGFLVQVDSVTFLGQIFTRGCSWLKAKGTVSEWYLQRFMLFFWNCVSAAGYSIYLTSLARRSFESFTINPNLPN